MTCVQWYLTNTDWSKAMSGRMGVGKVTKVVKGIGPFHQWRKEFTNRGVPQMVDKCSVDIIIPYHCNYDLVRRALLSILQHTRSNPYQVTLVDDGSPSKSAMEFIDTISQAPQTQCVRLEEQRGFGAAVRAGLAKTEQPYVCIMHSDCEVRHLNWLESMGEALVEHKKDSVRLVTARSDNPNDDDIPQLKLEYDDFNTSSVQKDVILVNKPLPLYCSMCHRDLFKRIGYIKDYPYTWFENEEFFYRMKYYGFKQAIATKSWIHHEGSATVDYILKHHPRPKEVETEMQKNRDRCLTELKQLYAKSM